MIIFHVKWRKLGPTPGSKAIIDRKFSGHSHLPNASCLPSFLHPPGALSNCSLSFVQSVLLSSVRNSPTRAYSVIMMWTQERFLALCFLGTRKEHASSSPYGWDGDIWHVSRNYDLSVPNGDCSIILAPKLIEPPANPCLKYIVSKKQI